MKHLMIITAVLLICVSNTLSHAEINVPQASCEIIPRSDSPDLAHCGILSVQMDVTSSDRHETADGIKRVYANAAKTYSTQEVNSLLATRDNDLKTVKTSLEQAMKALESSLPNAIGNKVEDSMKRNFREVLSDLIQTDPEFRSAIAEILKRK